MMRCYICPINPYRLLQGCNAVVFAAKWAGRKVNRSLSSDFELLEETLEGSNAPVEVRAAHAQDPLAVKMLFNYEAESNSFAILNAMHKETVPAKRILISDDGNSELGGDKISDSNRLPPHANIVDVKVAFADHIPHIVDAVNHYPDALPRR